MDGNTLRASVSVQGVPADWAELPKETAALLVEFRAPDEPGQEAYERAAAAVVEGLDLVAPVASVTNEFTRDAKAISGYWKARKAFVTAVGGSRPSGTTLITEDFAVPPSRLADACESLLGSRRSTASTPPSRVTPHTAICTSCSPSTRRSRPTSTGTPRSWTTSAG